MKKNGDLNMIDFTVFETNKKKLKHYRRITNIVMKKQQIAEIEQRLLLREILEIKKVYLAKWRLRIVKSKIKNKKNWNSIVE